MTAEATLATFNSSRTVCVFLPLPKDYSRITLV
jgi:hypothetical protein